MKRKNVWLRAVWSALLLAAAPSAMRAADPALTVRALSAQDDGPAVREQIQVEVFNPGSETWRNVNVRLATPGANSIERDLIQLGEIAGESLQSATTQLTLDKQFLASGEPLQWLVEFDSSTSGHQSVVVTPPAQGQ